MRKPKLNEKSPNGWNYWWAKKGRYWAAVKIENGIIVAGPYASLHFSELAHNVQSIVENMPQNMSPSWVPPETIIIPVSLFDTGP